MTKDEFYEDLFTFVLTLFNIEKQNVPRSAFAGIRNNKAKDKTTGTLRNTFSYEIQHSNGKINKIIFNLKDDGKYIYAKYIEERPDVITRGYQEKIEEDIAERIAKRYQGVLIK